MKATESELEILTVLWEKGPSTVRDVHEALAASKAVGYTTTLKIMQIMHKKGLLQRDEDMRSHVYSAAVSESDTKGEMVDKLLEAVFGGSASELVMQALGRHKASPEELKKIREYIQNIEKGNS
jgi:BlaI family transcriptional regulator, penicillinase repressor